MTRAASLLAREFAECEGDGVHVQLLWDPLGASGRLAAARQQEREALSRYRALIVADRKSLREAEEHFREVSDAIDQHVQAALAALAGRGNFSRAWVAASSATSPSSRRRAAERTPNGTARWGLSLGRSSTRDATSQLPSGLPLESLQ